MKILKAAIVAIAFGAVGAAYAQSTAPAPSVAPPAVQAACNADAMKFCPGLSGPDRYKCMTAHQAQLSKPCADAAATMTPRSTAPQ